MDPNRLALASLAMDLKRVALNTYQGSKQLALRFKQEAIKRKNEIDLEILPDYLKNIISNLDKQFIVNQERNADDFLMYSQLIQNFVVHKGGEK